MTLPSRAALAAVLALAPLVAHADPKPPAILSDHLVLQRDVEAPIWGWAEPGEAVTVEFGGQQQSTMAGADGQWKVRLKPMPASAEPRALTVRGKKTLTVSDVLVGEVWLCTGQSNMEWALSKSTGGEEAMAQAERPLLRLCLVPHNSQLTPQPDAPAHWAPSSGKAAQNFSAIGYWFGAKLQQELGVPVGIVGAPFGGTAIEAWMPLETLQHGPWQQDRHTDRALAQAEYDARVAKYKPLAEAYQQAKAEALKAHQTPPEMPKGAPGDFRGPGVLWNGMIVPLLPFPFRGVAWYQGESNAYVGVADTYAALLPAMIADWRRGFGQPALPFLIFQIAANRHPQTDPSEVSGIAVLQEAEAKTAEKTPGTALIVTRDLGEQDVHYHNKQPAAERAVRAALALAYGREEGETRSPQLAGMKLEGGRAILHFTHTAGGLVSKGEPLAGFALAGEDRKFAFASARIEGDDVIVTSPEVPQPVAVRYAWADFPSANLFGKTGLPVGPFRTDDWPVRAGAAAAK